MLKHWKLWLSAIVVALLYVLAGESPVEGIVQYGIIGSVLSLADVFVSAFDGPKERARKRRLKRLSEKPVTGLSEAQRQSMMTEALRGILGTQASATADLRRQAAASGGFGRSGRVQKLIGQQGRQTRDFQAKVGADIQKLSQMRFDENQRRKEAAQQQLEADAMAKAARVSQALGRTAGSINQDLDRVAKFQTNLLGKKN